MKEERPDASLLIGLHKLAERDGGGLVPELYEILADRGRGDDRSSNVVKFPANATVSATTVPRSEAGRVLPFRR
ncbi:hypothetical protein N7E02_08065 [Aliirhizobium terrae]|uniref:hypothetical protein n=1 Tax=Terrirhizobium terrae TaxID=2926709 RepID=UPI0025760CE6|nr:hypothetical protein [Rhizobium sp. CC-CFT758]WJH40561.1 hypothetical protein N7E02_08065 [Rhizobium sp. CC-CFT758]